MADRSDPVSEPNHHPPIPGDLLDPPLKHRDIVYARARQRHKAAGLGVRAVQRYLYARTSLLAAGTTYYLFIATFALLVFGYGLAAWIGAEQLSALITEAVEGAFPGLLDPEALTADALRTFGQTSSILGTLALLFSGTSAVIAAGHSVHLIYGAPLDPRNVVLARFRALGWLLVLGPLILLSFAATAAVTAALGPLGAITGPLAPLAGAGVQFLIYGLGFALDAGIIFLILSHFGGIRPSRSSRVAGSAIGALAIGALKAIAGLVIAWSIARPQFGAFTAPITILLLLFLQTIAVYGAAALTAGIAERHVPVDPATAGMPAVRSADA